MTAWKGEKGKVWLSWALWCAAVLALLPGVFWLLFVFTLSGAMMGWWAAIQSKWKERGAAAAAIMNSATFIGFGIGWLVLAKAGYV